MDNLLTVHFHSMHGDYSRYSMWKWLDGYWGDLFRNEEKKCR